jgi:hypothetical protein
LTEVANPELGRAQDVFRDVIWENLVQAGLAAWFTAVPAFGVWPLRPIVTAIVGMAQGWIYKAMREQMDLRVIALVNERAQREFDSAAVTLKLIERDYGPESDQYRKARDNAQVSLSRFLRYRGA